MTGLLTPELLSTIGRISEPQRELVTRRDIRKYAIATDSRARKYLDGDEAPPMFHVALFWDVVELDQLSPDGVSIDSLLPRFPLEKAMAGGLNIEYHKAIFPGDWLTSTRTLTNIYEKEGRSGSLIFYEVVMDVVDEQGELVIREKTTRILR
ncbi:MAG: hydroxyacyl-ACP dehydratase HTD2-like protein with hotdog domain [Bacteroidia bacterium]|jgi:hydroxyacyl-ACP dehydratase HTD2-like protein with hotdog domain